MARYRRAPSSGPVPYPDQSGRFLVDEAVDGDEWLPLLGLFVVEVDETTETKAEVAADELPLVAENPESVAETAADPVVSHDDKPPESQKIHKTVLEMAIEADDGKDANVSVLAAAILAQKSGTVSSDIAGVVDVPSSNEGAGAEGMDPEASGGSDPKGRVKRRSAGGRSQRG